MSSNIQMIPLDRLEHHPKNPRKEIGDVQELADSIRESGVLQNLTVVPHYGEVTGQPTGFYWVVIGNRRLEACQLAGLTEAPCVVVDMSPEEQFKTMMVENMQRCDLTPLEEADGFQMMLDMGSTVAQVAQQTGISETKIRSRIKMVKLDRKAAEKGLARGAALSDYIMLDQIKDQDRKNKVLKHIGTQNFRQKVQEAVNEEEAEAKRAEIYRMAEEAAWLTETDSIDWQIWERHDALMMWSKGKTLERPEDAGGREYCFIRDNYGITIYRKRKNVEKLIITKEIRGKYRDQLRGVTEELEAMGKSFAALRREFVYSFRAFNTYEAEIERMAVEAMVRGIQPRGEKWSGPASYRPLDWAPVAREMKIKHKKQDGTMDPVGIKAALAVQPGKMLLLASYEILEGMVREPWVKEYRNDIDTSKPIYNASFSMQQLYRLLAELGYGISKEEEAYMEGACLQFNEADAILDKFKEAMAKNE